MLNFVPPKRNARPISFHAFLLFTPPESMFLNIALDCFIYTKLFHLRTSLFQYSFALVAPPNYRPYVHIDNRCIIYIYIYIPNHFRYLFYKCRPAERVLSNACSFAIESSGRKKARDRGHLVKQAARDHRDYRFLSF